jgi:hypothetical protein
MINLILPLMIILLSACTSQPILPEKESVKVSRQKPDQDCEDRGKVTGSVIDASGTREQALEDLKQQVANKGANFVLIEQFSDFGTQVTGIAYKCP